MHKILVAARRGKQKGNTTNAVLPRRSAAILYTPPQYSAYSVSYVKVYAHSIPLKYPLVNPKLRRRRNKTAKQYNCVAIKLRDSGIPLRRSRNKTAEGPRSNIFPKSDRIFRKNSRIAIYAIANHTNLFNRNWSFCTTQKGNLWCLFTIEKPKK